MIQSISFTGTEKKHSNNKNTPLIKGRNLALFTGVGAMHGIAKVVNYTNKQSGSNLEKILYPLDDNLFNLMSKNKTLKKLAQFMEKADTKYFNISSFKINPSLMVKGAAFGASLYLIPKMVIAGIKKLESKIENK